MGIKQVLASYLSNLLYLHKNIQYRFRVKPCNKKIIFVVGAPRSGITLIQSIILANSRIAGFDEKTDFFMQRELFSRVFEGISESEYAEICNSNSDIVSVFCGLADKCLKLTAGAEYFLEKKYNIF